MLALADMKDMTEDQVKEHIAREYAGSVSGFDYGQPSDDDKIELAAKLLGFNILVAYESVGSWGCDSSSWFLLENKESGEYAIISGSHCSCFGFEGQGEIDPVDIDYLKSDRFYFGTGGYDEESEANVAAVKSFLTTL